ncbi:MAG: hypothetical protein IJ829_07450, partial [Kiritimatiellae bacterium]|nr:hypothetical protein [Kiritimatiellia bacterium]
MSEEKKKSTGKANEARGAGAMRSWLIIAAVVALFASFYRATPGEPPARELTLLEFYKALDEGKVVEPVVRFTDRDEGVTYLSGEMETDDTDAEGKPAVDKDGQPVRVRYRVPLVLGENEPVMDDLLARMVQVQIKERKSPFSPFVMNLLLLGGTMLLLYWLVVRRMGGGDGVFGMGKSRAKLLNASAERAKVTFSDVAGIDEAKEEVQEIVAFLKEPAAFCRLGGRIPK